jgi:thiol-disulfide isomerase/thioredoxin
VSLKVGTPLPDLKDLAEWNNLSAGETIGFPLLVQFWAVSCPACKHNFPLFRSIQDEYRPKGMHFLSIHRPRNESDQDVTRVFDTIREYNFQEPSAVDNQHIVSDRFDVGRYWPAYFLFNTEGNLKRRSFGELGLKMCYESLKLMIDGPKDIEEDE